MASTRSSRSATATLEVVSHLSARERLLVAQAVYEYGANAWPDISKVLSKHPLINRPKGFFSPQACQTIYVHLMGEAGYECSDETHAPHARLNLKLAQRHYQARVVELRSLILAEEERFKTLATEIDDIRAGRWDHKIAQELGISLDSGDAVVPEPPEHTNSPPAESLTPTEASAVLETLQTGSAVSLTSDSIEQIQGQVVEPADEIRPTSGEYVQDPGVGTIMDIEPIVVLPHAVPSLQAGTSPPSESFRARPIHKENETIIKLSEPMGIADDRDEVAEHPTVISGPENTDEQDESSPDLKSHSQNVSPSTLPEGQAEINETQTLPLILQVESRPSIPSREGRTQEEIKAIEALEELSRQKVEDRSIVPSSQEHPGDPMNTCPPIDATSQQVSPLEHISVEGREYNVEMVTEAHASNTPLTRPLGKRKVSEVEPLTPDSSRDKKKARDESVPTEDDDIGPVRRRSKANIDPSTLKKFQTVISVLHSQISQLRNGNIFHNPVKDSDAPDYHEIVKRPMDLKTMKIKIKDGLISNSEDYQRDLYLMFANAMMYNRPKSDIYRLAQEMMVESEGHVRDFRQTEGFLSRGKR